MTLSESLAPNANLFAALRAGFPADLDSVAIEADGDLLMTIGAGDVTTVGPRVLDRLADRDRDHRNRDGRNRDEGPAS